MIRPLNALLLGMLSLSMLSLSMLSLSGLFALASLQSARAQDLAPIPPLTSPVVDATGTLSASEIAQLEQQALALQQRKGSQLQILIVSTTRPEAIEPYAQRVFDQWKIGRQGVDDGVLLLVAKDDREVRIQAGYGLEGVIPDIAAGRIVQEYLVPKFRSGDFAGGIGDASAQLARLIDGEALPPPMANVSDEKPEWFPGMFLALFVSMFMRALLRGLPTLLRMAITVSMTVGVLMFFSAPWPVILVCVIVAAAIGAMTGSGGYARHGSWGSFGGGASSGRSWGGGSSGSTRSSGSGWSGGGGSSGGGGASGRW